MENATDVNRIILFCDVERPMKYGFMTAINRWVSHHIVKASATQNMEGEHVGALNKVFGKLYEVHLASRKVKEMGERRRERKADEVNATPAAVELADELDVDLHLVDGTGADDRITVADVRKAAREED